MSISPSTTGPLASFRRRPLPVKIAAGLVALWLAFSVLGVVVGALVGLLKLAAVVAVAVLVVVLGLRVLDRR